MSHYVAYILLLVGEASAPNIARRECIFHASDFWGNRSRIIDIKHIGEIQVPLQIRLFSCLGWTFCKTLILEYIGVSSRVQTNGARLAVTWRMFEEFLPESCSPIKICSSFATYILESLPISCIREKRTNSLTNNLVCEIIAPWSWFWFMLN